MEKNTTTQDNPIERAIKIWYFYCWRCWEHSNTMLCMLSNLYAGELGKLEFIRKTLWKIPKWQTLGYCWSTTQIKIPYIPHILAIVLNNHISPFAENQKKVFNPVNHSYSFFHFHSLLLSSVFVRSDEMLKFYQKFSNNNFVRIRLIRLNNSIRLV